MKVELCASSIEAIKIAEKYHFDRIELCQNLEQGGITPSAGLIEFAQDIGVNTHVLIRPRPGGFCYSKDEMAIMLRDIECCKSLGVKGVVIGVLNEDKTIDEKAINLMIEKANGMDVTFHRAFDDTTEFEKSIDILVNAGVKRILSSGVAGNVELGLDTLKQMKAYAGGRIEIMPGGGVNASNIQRIKEVVKPDAIHFSGTKQIQLDENSMFSESVLGVGEDKVQRILKEIGRSL